MKPVRSKFTLLLRRGLLCLIALSSVAIANHLSAPSGVALSATLQARVKLQLCAEYPFGGVSASVKYRVANGTEFFDADVITQSIDTNTNSGTFEIELPSTLGTQELHVSAFCHNSFGGSDSSNVVTTSNCVSLSTIDSDLDGLPNNFEDTNCDNFFSPGDSSNPDNLDSDGDGIRDLIEVLSQTDPTNPGSSPRPRVWAGGPIDNDGDGNSNPIVWRNSNGYWFIRDFITPGNNLAFQYGLPGDIPFAYDAKGIPTTGVGVIRTTNNQFNWLFRGPGFIRNNASAESIIQFGVFGDNIVPGPWEEPGVTNPAVARLFNGGWTFYVYLADGSLRIQPWGRNGDVPFVSDYDGDGIFDIAVFRPEEQNIYSINSTDLRVSIFNFGTGTAEFTFRGDVTGDGKDDISFWEPINGMFSTMTSDNGFDDAAARAKDPDHYSETQLGLYFVHLPLSWNQSNGKTLYSVVDHASGWRFVRDDNDLSNPIEALQWGLPGDAQG